MILGCVDVADRLGIPHEPGSLPAECCPSCHEDADEGYLELPDVEVDGEPAQVCCAILRALEPAC